MPQPDSESTASSTPRQRRLGPALLITLLVIALLAGGAYYLVQRARGGESPAAGDFGGGRAFGGGVTVGTALAQAGALPILIDALGTVTPPASVALVPQVSGILTEVLFTEGQMVKKGDLLARIDARPYEQTLAQARGQRARDEAQLGVARVTLSRYQTLLKQDSIARQEVDDQAALVQQLQGVVEADRAAEQAAQIDVGFTEIRAPISGRIGLRAVDPGNLVSTGTSSGIATITQIAPIDVVFSVPQDRVQAVQEATRAGKLPVLALSRARTDTLAQGTFLTLNNEINTATGTVLAKARFENADQRLFPNEFVNARLQLGQAEGVLVPVTAVRTGPDGDYVYVVDDADVAHMRSVTTTLATPEQTLVTSGLKSGERVVTAGGDRVKDGGKVTLLPPETSADTATVGTNPGADKPMPQPKEREEGDGAARGGQTDKGDQAAAGERGKSRGPGRAAR